MAEHILLKGIRVFAPNHNAPEFVKATGNIDIAELKEFINSNQQLLTEYNGKKQLKFKILQSAGSKYYMEVDTFKPSTKIQSQNDDLPF